MQGTDGGAIYGTDSIDEQLALERMLDLTYEELMAMKKAEDLVLRDSLNVFEEKKKNLVVIDNYFCRIKLLLFPFLSKSNNIFCYRQFY